MSILQLLLYGISMIYGVTKSLDMMQVLLVIAKTPADHQLVLLLGLVFALVGVAFKLGVVPFHMWVPDVYQGAPASVTLFIATAPKLAAFGLLIHILVDSMQLLYAHWEHLVMMLAILSMALGNLVAIVQTSIKRMLAYSSIAHMGYMLLGILAGNAAGYGASMFYMIIYTIMSLGAFGILVILSRGDVEIDAIDDLKGLNARNPWLAFMMLLIMFSMAGVPPSAGFFAKISVLEALVQVHLVWLAALALFFAVIGAYYYLRVVKVMYFDAPQDKTAFTIGAFDLRVAISINGLSVLLLGIFPGALMGLCKVVL